MTALSQISPPSLAMDKPLVIAVSRGAVRAVRAVAPAGARRPLTFFALLGAGAAFGLYRGQWRRKSYALLEASAERERRKTAEQLELALEGADLGLWDWDVRNDRFNHNEVVRRQLGYAPGELGDSGSAWRDIVHRDDAERLISSIEAHFRRESAAYECEFRVRHKDGHWVWLLSRGKVVERDGLDTPVRMTGTHMDLTRRKSAEAEAERSAEMLRRTGELANIGGWELDLTTMRYDWTEQVFRIHELEPGPTPRLDDAMNHYPPEGRPSLLAAIEAGAREGTPWDLELPFVTAKGNPRWVRAQGVAVCEDGRPVRLLGAFQDITEKKNNALELHRLNEELTRLSTTDALTEVGNRRLFDQTLKSEWLRAARRGGPIGLLMIDVDHFKEYNDHYGHPAGDAVLRQIARHGRRVGAARRRAGRPLRRRGVRPPPARRRPRRRVRRRRALPPARHRRQDRAPRLDDVGVARRQHRRRQPGRDAGGRLRRPGRDRRRRALPRQALRPGPDRVLTPRRRAGMRVTATKASYSGHGKALTAADADRASMLLVGRIARSASSPPVSKGNVMSLVEGLASLLTEMGLASWRSSSSRSPPTRWPSTARTARRCAAARPAPRSPRRSASRR